MLEPRPTKGEPLGDGSLAAESREGFRKSDLSARLGRYAKAKANALQFSRYIEQQGKGIVEFNKKDKRKELLHLAKRVRDCGGYAVFRDYFTIGEIRLSSFCTCHKHLICPLCAIRRGARALRVYLAKVDALLKENSRLRPFLVTLTVKNGEDLGERFKHLSKHLRSYHKRRSGARQHGEILKASSAVWSYEFTNRGKGWHPHVHSVWLCEDAPDAHKLSEEWRELTGDSFIVDVSPMSLDSDGSFVSGFVEVFKYAIKFADLANDHRLEAFYALKGKRLQDSFGQLRGLDVEVKDSDDLLDDLPYIERMFHFIEGQGYVEESTGEVFQHAA